MVVILRAPTAAGTFYELNSDMLRKQLDFYFRNALVKTKRLTPLVAIVPHSEYIYSGQVAAHAYANMLKSNFIIFGSNHSGIGSNFALMKNSLWKTPVGETLVDDVLADRLLKGCELVEYDAIPHENEFSVEVQLPFLLHRFGDIKILPIVVNNQLPDESLLESCEVVGSSVAKLIKKEQNWKVICSSDLSQGTQKEFTERTDRQLIKSILKLDAGEFFDRIVENNAQVCGYASIATTIFAAKKLGARKGELLKYSTSADIGEVDKAVTGYASIIFY